MLDYFTLFNLNFNHALKPAEIIFVKCNKQEKLRRLLSAFKDLFYTHPQIELSNSVSNPDFLFIKSMKRPDYDQLFFQIANSCSKPKITADIFESRGKFSILQFLYFISFIPIFLKVSRRNLILWAFLCISMTKILCQIKLIPGIRLNRIVVFADMQPLDNLLVQYANRKKIESATMQHGLYVDYNTYSNVNIVNYLNADARDFLAWGQDTAELIQKYHPGKKVYLCGKPTLSEESVKKKEEYFTVIFDQNIFFPYNHKILEIAYKLSDVTSLKVNMRLHPNNRIKWFKLQPEKTIIDMDIWSSKFVLGHTSSLIYECMRLGIPAFRYNTDIPSVKTPDYIQFDDIDDLIGLVKNINKIPLDDLSKNYIVEIGQKSVIEYGKYFDGVKEAFHNHN